MFIVRRIKNDELTHHGIKNQHWGVRNGPPYPLDRKTSSRIKKGHNEKLRDKKKVGSSKYASALGNTWRYPAGYGSEKAKSEGNKWKDNESHLREVIAVDKGGGRVGYADVFEAGFGDFINSGFNNEDGIYNDYSLSSDAKKTIRENGFGGSMTGKICLAKINTDENKDEFGSTRNNCSKCSDMVELIMRGLSPNELSAGRCQYGMLDTAQEYHWDGAIPYKEKSLTNIENRIKSFGNHGSGTISIRRADGSGHSMHFSRLKNGSIEVQDGQIGKTYSSISEALSAEGHDFNQFCKITRLDCATPNVKHMQEDSVLRIDTYIANKSGNVKPSVLRGDTVYSDTYNTFTEWGKK